MNLFIAGTDVACVLISLVILCAILFSGEKGKAKNRYLLLGVALLIFFSAADSVSYIADAYGGGDTLLFCSNLLAYVGADLITVAFVYYLSERIREKCAFSRAHARIVLVGSSLDMAFLISGAYSGSLFRIENGKTIYGELNKYLGILQFFAFVYFVAIVFLRRKYLGRRFVVSLALYFLMPVLAMVVMLISGQFALTYLSSALSFLIMYVVIAQEDLQASMIGERIMHQASVTDNLTGLMNRKAYSEEVARLNAPYPSDLAYVSLDLNGLKVANDTLGHAAGDEIIAGAAQCMKSCLGLYGHVYRTGGDEFTAILRVPAERLQAVMDDFDDAVAGWHGALVDAISVSHGCVKAEEMNGLSMHEVSVLADKRMYTAKSRYYRQKGVDRRGQAAAHKALCDLYTKILKIDLTGDTYSIVNMDASEQTVEKGFTDTISGWLRGFGISGQVHEDDLDEYLEKTDIEYLKRYFRSGKTSISIFYRRKYEDGFKQVAMEMIPADDYEETRQTLFLYVKDIDV